MNMDDYCTLRYSTIHGLWRYLPHPAYYRRHPSFSHPHTLVSESLMVFFQ